MPFVVFTREHSFFANCGETLESIISEPMSPIEISANGISNVIRKMKLSSASRTDNINSKILKNTQLIISTAFQLLFSQSLSQGQVPSDWKLGKITPLFKNGKKVSPYNYRPISLTSVPSKIMEHILFTNIINHLEQHNFIHPSQHGFRKGLSCETQLAAFIHDLHTNLDRNIQTDAIFLDFEKAFDKVPHHRLMTKLSLLNLDPFVLSWINNFLTDRKQFVVINTARSQISPVLSGVPQGTVLGPLLFLIYINDLPRCISNNIRLFADDCVIYATISSHEDQIALQTDLTAVKNWCHKWQMSLNISKCRSVSFHRRTNPLVYNYTLHNSFLQLASSYKYLGIHISSDLSWTLHINHVISTARRSLGYIQRTLKFAPAT